MLAILGDARVVLLEELRRVTRAKSYLFMTALVPGILVILMLAIPTVRALVDNDTDEEKVKPTGIVVLTDAITLDPSTLPGFDFVRLDSREAGLAAIAADTVEQVFVIPEGYVQTGEVEWLHRAGSLLSGFDAGPGEGTAGLLRAYLRLALAGDALAPDIAGRAIGGTLYQDVRVGGDGQPVAEDTEDEIGKFIVAFGATMVMMMAIIAGASTLVQAVTEEKESRMIEVLLTSVPPVSIMAGKVLGIGTAMLLSTTVSVASLIIIGPRVFDAFPNAPDLPLDFATIAWAIAFFVTGYFLSAVLLAGIGSMATKVREASQLAVVVIMPMVLPVYALALILEQPDGTLARILSFFPLTAPVTMLTRMAADGSSTLESLASLTVLILGSVATLWASARVFRAGLLMYGQRMSLRAMVRAIRQAG